ncbi:MAG: NADH-quinone oxidoreductase subunit K [Proteobacteria bacterium]|nr:NADH-quinone oxidoreductase subunit K [Pseudomonadota bacterium]
MSDVQQKIEQVVAVLTETVRDFAPVAFANSLGAEDMVLTDIIDRYQLPIEMFSLDAGRLPQETYDLMQTVRKRYKTPLRIYFPNVKQVEAYVAEHGVNGVVYSNPLPHVLILTAIVVGVATLAVGLAIAVRIREAFGTVEAEEIESLGRLESTQTGPSA